MNSEYLTKILNEIHEKIELLDIYVSSRLEAKQDQFKHNCEYKDNLIKFSEREF